MLGSSNFRYYGANPSNDIGQEQTPICISNDKEEQVYHVIIGAVIFS